MPSEPLTKPSPESEERRLQLLEEYGLFDTPAEPDFDRLAAVAARFFRTPIALISLVGRDRQYFKAHHGTDLCETSRTVSFCAHALTETGPLIVLDATKDPRFSTNPLVIGPPGIRFYAGAPLVTGSGHMLGTLCVVDFSPRAAFGADERETLQDLAALVMQQMEMRRLRRLNDAALRAQNESNRQFEILVGGVKEYALYMLSPKGIVASWNSGAQAIKGYSAEEIIGQHYSRFYTEADRAAGRPQRALRIATEEGRFEDNAQRVRKDGSLFWANVVIDAIRDQDGRLIGFAKITRDITERRRHEDHLRHLAQTDMLTGLRSRYGFLKDLDAILQGQNATILVVDLDGFKDINDTHGHHAGDAVLKTVAQRLQTTVAGDGIVGRLGGDEFAVVIPRTADPIEACNQAQAIVAAFQHPVLCEASNFQVRVSVGIAIAPNHGRSANELLSNADLAMYDAKAQRRTGYSLFREVFRQSALARLACETELKRAVANDELELYFQPQIRLSDRRIVGAEALLRWNHPQRGLILPGAFIKVLERSLLARSVGNWVIRQACRFASAVRQQGNRNFYVAVNLFSAQFRSGDLKTVIASALAEYQLSPSALEVEITENIALQNDESVVVALRELWEIGVQASFDDYGTGFASLSMLKRFPLARLKIDQSFIRNLCTDPEDAAVVKAILFLAKSFSLDVVAEGVEREEQESSLRELGCKYAQGYLFARPQPAADLEAVLAGGGPVEGEYRHALP